MGREEGEGGGGGPEAGPAGRARPELECCLVSTGQHLAFVRLAKGDTVRSLCRNVAEAVGSSFGECIFRVFFRGRIVESAATLADAGLSDESVIDMVRCWPDSVISTASDGVLKTWSRETGECTTTISSQKRGSALPAFSSNSLRVVTVPPHSNTARISASCNGDPEHVVALKGHEAPITAAVFSPSGLQVATAAEDNTARIWETEKGRQLRALVGHAAEVTSVAFTRDGRHLASGSCDGSVRVWSVQTGACAAVLAGHPWSVNSVHFSPDGRLLVTGSDDRTAKIWDVGTGSCLQTFMGHRSPVTEALFSE